MAEALAPALGISPDAALHSPHALVGSVDQIRSNPASISPSLRPSSRRRCSSRRRSSAMAELEPLRFWFWHLGQRSSSTKWW